MDKSNEITDPRFDLFINDQMTSEDKKSFMLALESNMELQESFEIHQDAVIAIRALNEDLLRKKISHIISADREVKTERIGKGKTKSLVRRMSYLAAASLIFFIGTNLFLESSSQTYNLSDTYSSIIELELDKTSRAGFANTNDNKSLSKALRALKTNKSYSTSTELLSEAEKEKISILEELNEIIFLKSKTKFDSRKVTYKVNEELYDVVKNLVKLKQRSTRKQAISYFETLSKDENSEFAHIAKKLITYD